MFKSTPREFNLPMASRDSEGYWVDPSTSRRFDVRGAGPFQGKIFLVKKSDFKLFRRPFVSCFDAKRISWNEKNDPATRQRHPIQVHLGRVVLDFSLGARRSRHRSTNSWWTVMQRLRRKLAAITRTIESNISLRSTAAIKIIILLKK